MIFKLKKVLNGVKILSILRSKFEKGEFVSNFRDFEVLNIFNKSLKYMLVISILLFTLFYNNISYALGFVLGSAACLVNFNLMADSIKGMVSKTTFSKAFFSAHILLRLVFVTAVLLGALLLESINLAAAVAGLLTIRIVIAAEAVRYYIKSYNNPE